MAFSFISSPSFSWRKAPAWITLFWRLLEKDHIINGNRQTSWTSIIWKVLLDLQWSRIVFLLWSYIRLRLWDSYLDIQKHQMTWLTKRVCDIADDQKDKCEKRTKRSHERSTVQVELEKSFATGERRAIWRSALTYDTFKNEDTFKKWSSPSWWRIPCWGLHMPHFLKVFYKIGVVLFHHIPNALLFPQLLGSFVITLSFRSLLSPRLRLPDSIHPTSFPSSTVSSSALQIIVFLV